MQPSVVQTRHESGDKNSYQFLIKILTKHFPEHTWYSTYNQMKKETQNDMTQNGKIQNIHWKQIVLRVCGEAMNKGPDSKDWQTLLKLLEIVKNPEPFLTCNGRQIIKWKTSNSAFVKKCQNQIANNIFSLMRSAVENSRIHPNIRHLFYESLEANYNTFNTLEPNIFIKREEDHHNKYYQGEDINENSQKPYKKLKTETIDVTFTSQYHPKEQDDMIFI